MDVMTNSPHPAYRLLEQLDAARIYYTLTKVRADAIMVEARVPGRHYEIEVFADGHMEVEIYVSDGQIGGQEMVAELLRHFSCQ